MDIWEANNNAAAYTPHPCSTTGQTRCSGTDCGAGSDRYSGLCDKDGCDFNSFRMGDQTFLGKGLTVDTSKPFTVVTQFLTTDGTSSGNLNEIRRFYVQNGQVIPNSFSSIAGITAANSITDAFCTQQKTAFGDTDYFETKGGLAQMGAALKTGMVLALSIWDDYAAYMQWLDSDYPTDVPATNPGVSRGPCATNSGAPTTIENQNAGASVQFSNIKFGPINSTFSNTGGNGSPPSGGSSSVPSGGHSSTTTPVHTTTTSSPPSSGTGVAQHWAQCGGTGYTGPTTCASPYKCTYSNPYYSQCL